ncbi:MAG: hypothetical protein JXB36_01360 [Gammaproteobacteria bacterium]|nr:hypothetical protein [Gammaproteobacteria bacterium]
MPASMIAASGRLFFTAALIAAAAGCSYRVGYEPDYVPEERPPFVAQGKLLIVMPEEQYRYTFQGSPESEVGDYTTMEIPVGAIVTDVARDVFDPCFASGLVFADDRFVDEDYVLAVEGDLDSFMYRYSRIVETGFDETEADIWIAPEVRIALDVRVYDSGGRQLLDETYDSGLVSGEPYRTAMRPAESVNQVLHATLHALMLDVADDLRPLLIGRCEVEDRQAPPS